MPHKVFTDEELANAVETKLCGACGAAMAMVRTEKGSLMPVSLTTKQSHFLDCTDPGRFGRRR